MRKNIKLLVGLVLFGVIAHHGYSADEENSATAAKMPAIPKGKESDVKYYTADRGTLFGREALEQMPKQASYCGLREISSLPWTKSYTLFRSSIQAPR